MCSSDLDTTIQVLDGGVSLAQIGVEGLQCGLVLFQALVQRLDLVVPGLDGALQLLDVFVPLADLPLAEDVRDHHAYDESCHWQKCRVDLFGHCSGIRGI